MTNKEVTEIIKITRNRAKFVNVSHSDEFIDEQAPALKKFFYVNLYDEFIDSNVLKIGRILILIQNTYLSSFAYNLGLCWLYSILESKDYSISNNYLLKHNFKKFFAEQLYYFKNNIFSRAILLETLLFEQEIMVNVFEKRNQNAELDKKANFIANLFSSLLSNHELAHFYLDEQGKFWREFISNQNAIIQDFYATIKGKYPLRFEEEIKCDIISVISSVNQEEEERSFVLNCIIWGFTCFSVMYSLMKSAKHTIKQQKGIDETVDFNSIESIKRNYDFFLGRDEDFIERAKNIISLCSLIAESENLLIFEKQREFPIPKSILDNLLDYIDVIMENYDMNSRKMSMLVAESLSKHEVGMEYLYLRSKTFISNRKRLDL